MTGLSDGRCLQVTKRREEQKTWRVGASKRRNGRLWLPGRQGKDMFPRRGKRPVVSVLRGRVR